MVSGRRLHRRYHSGGTGTSSNPSGRFRCAYEGGFHFRTLEAASALAAANKRVSNILAKSDETLNERVNAATLKEPEEIALAMQVVVLRDKLEPYFAEGRYQEALVELAELRDVIDAFFEKVMVNVEDKELRINRLSMLEKLRELFLRVADISLLQ